MLFLIAFIAICIASFTTGMFLAERKARIHWEELYGEMRSSRHDFAERNIKYIDEIKVLDKQVSYLISQVELYKGLYESVDPNAKILLADPTKDELRILRNAFHPDKHQGKHHELWVKINDLYENAL